MTVMSDGFQGISTKYIILADGALVIRLIKFHYLAFTISSRKKKINQLWEKLSELRFEISDLKE